MTAVVFLVHGMGDHPAGWSAPIRTRLQALATDLKESVTTSLDLTIGEANAEVLVREIRYDDIFEGYFARNRRDAEALLRLGDEQHIQLPVDALFSWLAGTDDETRDFFMTHVADVLLFRLFPMIRKKVVEHVALQILREVAALSRGGGTLECSVLAHSLGTAVTEQSLHRLASAPLNGNTTMQPPSFRFQNIAMVANVSRVLERADVYRSIVGPPGRTGTGWYTARYLSFRHGLDPFTMVRRFDPPGDWHPPAYHQPADLAHFLLFNVHDWEHYLVHPAVHLPLFNALWNEPIVAKAEIARRVAAYRPLPPSACLAEVQQMHSTLIALSARLKADPSFTEWCRAITEFLVQAQRLAKDCPKGAILE